MSASQIRTQIARKNQQYTEANNKAGEYRNKESKKRSDAALARTAVSKTKSESIARNKASEATRRDTEAQQAGKEANRWQTKANGYLKEKTVLETRLIQAEKSENSANERKLKRDHQQTERQAAARSSALDVRISLTEQKVNEAVRSLRSPRQEKLRVLLLGSSSEGDLRVGREQSRIRKAVESALHRDLIELDVRPAATTDDLLDGISKFRPHIVHFSGHSDTDLLVFERNDDSPHAGQAVSAKAFARVIEASGDLPLLIVLNACNSAAQIGALVESFVPFAIGMSNEIADGDAIVYAAQLYASIANGQSIHASHLFGQAALELAGLEGAELPTLAHAPDVDPSATILVQPAE